MKSGVEMKKAVRADLAKALVHARKRKCGAAKQFLRNANALVRDSEYKSLGFRIAGDKLRPRVKSVSAKVSRYCK